MSHGELVSLAKRDGYKVDETVEDHVLQDLLGGKRINPEVPTPVWDAAEEMQGFVSEHRHRLNLDCTGECVCCTGVVIAMCYAELDNVRKELHELEENPEEGVRRTQQSGTAGDTGEQDQDGPE